MLPQTVRTKQQGPDDTRAAPDEAKDREEKSTLFTHLQQQPLLFFSFTHRVKDNKGQAARPKRPLNQKKNTTTMKRQASKQARQKERKRKKRDTKEQKTMDGAAIVALFFRHHSSVLCKKKNLKAACTPRSLGAPPTKRKGRFVFRLLFFLRSCTLREATGRKERTIILLPLWSFSLFFVFAGEGQSTPGQSHHSHFSPLIFNATL